MSKQEQTMKAKNWKERIGVGLPAKDEGRRVELPAEDESQICDRCGGNLYAYAVEGRSDVYLECQECGSSQGIYTFEEYQEAINRG